MVTRIRTGIYRPGSQPVHEESEEEIQKKQIEALQAKIDEVEARLWTQCQTRIQELEIKSNGKIQELEMKLSNNRETKNDETPRLVEIVDVITTMKQFFLIITNLHIFFDRSQTSRLPHQERTSAMVARIRTGIYRPGSQPVHEESDEEIQKKEIQALKAKIEQVSIQSQTRIQELEMQLSNQKEQSDAKMQHANAKISELESTIVLQNDASQNRIVDLEMQLTTLMTVSKLSSLARQAQFVWQDYFGNVGRVPDLPSNINDILNSNCPFWPSKRVCDTHILALIPATVNGQPFTLNLLGNLIQNPHGNGHTTNFHYYEEKVRNEVGDKPINEPSYWILMTRNVLDGSRNKSFAEQQSMVMNHANYQVPTVLEAATAIVLHHVHGGERLLSDAPWTFTLCGDAVGPEFTLVGGIDSNGFALFFNNTSSLHEYYGVACCQRL